MPFHAPIGIEVVRASLSENVLAILGSTGTIIPIGDTNHENSGRTTVTSVGEEQTVFTYSEAVTAFDTPPTTLGPGKIPIITFNGTDEEADGVDSAYWSRDDAGGANGFSIGAWVNVTDTANTRVILAKWNATSGSEVREWQFGINDSDGLFLLLEDESANVQTQRASDATITQGSLRFFVMTYDGAGGATAGDTITLYDNGAVLASTATNNASYVGMEDLNTLPTLGFNTGVSAPGNFFSGTMAGGPFAPFFVQRELTTDEILRLYQLGKVALGV